MSNSIQAKVSKFNRMNKAFKAVQTRIPAATKFERKEIVAKIVAWGRDVEPADKNLFNGLAAIRIGLS